MFLFSAEVVGQNVAITSTASPGPTSSNPIPITIKFEDAVDNLITADFNLNNGSLNNLVRQLPDFNFRSKKLGSEEFAG